MCVCVRVLSSCGFVFAMESVKCCVEDLYNHFSVSITGLEMLVDLTAVA